MRFRPCIDLRKGRVVQIVGSSLKDEDQKTLVTNFEARLPSADYARQYRMDDLEGGHIISLGPGNDAAALAALKTFPGGLQMGGGITPENAGTFLDAGASHVIVTSYVFRDGRVDDARLKRLQRAVGKRRLVLDLSCRKREGDFFVVTDRWQKFTHVAVCAETLDRLALHCDEFLVHGVDVEGMRLGIDTTLVKLLGKTSPIACTYAGGAKTLDDLERVKRLGDGRIDLTIGSALDIFGGDVPYQDVVAWQRALQAEDPHK